MSLLHEHERMFGPKMTVHTGSDGHPRCSLCVGRLDDNAPPNDECGECGNCGLPLCLHDEGWTADTARIYDTPCSHWATTECAGGCGRKIDENSATAMMDNGPWCQACVEGDPT